MIKLFTGLLLAAGIFCFIMADIADGARPASQGKVPVPTVAEIMDEAAGDHEAAKSEADSIEENDGADTSAQKKSVALAKTAKPQTEADDVHSQTDTAVRPMADPSLSSEPPVQTPLQQASEPVQQKYSVTGPDGQTYTSYQPICVVCTCGQKFSSGAEWQEHHDYYASFRCECGASFSVIGEWETHAGIYDPAAYLYTGKSYEQAAAEGHHLTNETTHSSEVTAHGGWYTN